MRFTAISVVVLVCASAPARADAPRTRDGLYLGLGLGLSAISMQREGHISSGSGPAAYTGDSSISGGGGAFEVSVGGTLRPGLVLAGTLVHQSVSDPRLRADSSGDEVPLEGSLQFALLGATLKWFPRPHGGFHLGGTLGLAGAWAKSPPPHFAEYLGGAGGAIALDGGYLWWISDQWSLGVAARLTAARLHGEVTQLNVTGSEDDSVGAFMLALSAAYH
jgi:hypothetical protein